MAEGVGGWLLLLCRLLVVFHPLSLAVTASGALGALSVRGTAVASILMLRLIVVGFGMAAGRALQHVQPGAVTLAKAALLASAATDVFVYTTPYFPNNRVPGDTPSITSPRRSPITARGCSTSRARSGCERLTRTHNHESHERHETELFRAFRGCIITRMKQTPRPRGRALPLPSTCRRSSARRRSNRSARRICAPICSSSRATRCAAG